jgi:hypothetical protein
MSQAPSSDNHSATELQVSDDMTAMVDIIGSDYIDEDLQNAACLQENSCVHNVGDDCLTKRELESIRAHIGSTNRPSWHRGPPLNFREAAHGKLKADQWRSCIEFDLPVSLAQIWLSNPQNDQKAKRRQKLAESTMLLAMAIQWATSHITSKKHADQYTKYMQAYLNSLIELYPNIRLRPSHHAALHIGPFLLRFGPMHGWWMFPFERIIGTLQKINTNNILGELIL